MISLLVRAVLIMISKSLLNLYSLCKIYSSAEGENEYDATRAILIGKKVTRKLTKKQ